ncbi:hypothetical protein [Bradyrhizobium sp. 2TAF24]|uniref:hypothetical protein n=1 Tax=Bradyrhizobium sp. 2TAF24 TaxID=3233011 RepID=UPI003F8DF440
MAIETDEQMFLQLRTNGVAIRTGRCVFDAGCNGIRLQCNCGHAFEPDDSYVRAVGAWAGGDDQARFPCHKCNQDRLLAEWRGPVVWGLGHLGFEFWNWPPLSEKFIAALRHKLGHRTIVVYRRL